MKVVVVHRGSRDAYQAACALQEAGMLDRLVTDLYWPADRSAANYAKRFLPAALGRALMKRYAAGLPSQKVDTASFRGFLSHALEFSPVPFAWKRGATRRTDAALGRRAGRLAVRNGSALMSYSYYAHTAFQHQPEGRPRILFQLHPHPASVRRILESELAAHPDCAESLLKEWELSLPQEDFDRLSAEALQAEYCICASSFTRRTLVENGVDERKIHVIPYGVDLDRFSPGLRGPRDGASPATRRLRLLFTGRINQRKGIKYLLEALRLLKTRQIEVQVCGRVVDDLRLFKPFEDQVKITPSVSHAELVEAYRAADLFVLPSVAEGFGQVLLESLACGLPVLSTTRTAAPDLIREAEQGFVVAPGDAAALAERIEWALANRARLTEMRAEARTRAEQFTWERFRTHFAAVVRQCMSAEPVPGAVHAAAQAVGRV
jgi:glycosyltransferase involved in cell wall biosynthesis